eukprot:755365-Hanusia_phi.AAC.4
MEFSRAGSWGWGKDRGSSPSKDGTRGGGRSTYPFEISSDPRTLPLFTPTTPSRYPLNSPKTTPSPCVSWIQNRRIQGVCSIAKGVWWVGDNLSIDFRGGVLVHSLHYPTPFTQPTQTQPEPVDSTRKNPTPHGPPKQYSIKYPYGKRTIETGKKLGGWVVSTGVDKYMGWVGWTRGSIGIEWEGYWRVCTGDPKGGEF